jgi:UDP-3-O-[3-hydroxymyristoyl] glucosamine N-acyltransferase
MDIKEIAKILDVEYHGDSFEITALNELKAATNSELSFVSNPKYIKDLQTSKAGAFIVEPSLADQVPESAIALVADEPYLMVAKLSKYFAPAIEDENVGETIIDKSSKVSKKAEIASGAIIGKNCTIMAHVYIGSNCIIGDNTILYPGVVVYRDCKVGDNCIIHANSVIGGDGFGFATSKSGEHIKIYQNGNVVIEDDVEIGSCTTIDRAALGTTLIKKGTHIDNLVQVGHNCEIGEYSVLVAQVGLSGSSKLGRNVVMGGQSATSGHLEIAPFTTLAARSGVTKSIMKSGGTFSGFPLMEHKLWLKLQAKLAKLIKS